MLDLFSGQRSARIPALVGSAECAECRTGDDFPIQKERWEEQVGPYRRVVEARGKRPFVVLMRNAWLGDTFDGAAREFGDITPARCASPGGRAS